MRFLKNKYLRIALAVLLILCVPLGVYAVRNGILPESSAGGYYSATVNRVDFRLDKTEFTLPAPDAGNDTYLLRCTLTIRKCEPDFYACIHSVDIAGAPCNYTVFTAAEENGNDYLPEELILRSSEALSWDIEISLDASAVLPPEPVVNIEYTSGMTYDTADSHLLSIPLRITFK